MRRVVCKRPTSRVASGTDTDAVVAADSSDWHRLPGREQAVQQAHFEMSGCNKRSSYDQRARAAMCRYGGTLCRPQSLGMKPKSRLEQRPKAQKRGSLWVVAGRADGCWTWCLCARWFDIGASREGGNGRWIDRVGRREMAPATRVGVRTNSFRLKTIQQKKKRPGGVRPVRVRRRDASLKME
jgi:hypothetical protein